MALLMEIPAGGAAPAGCTVVWHNGKQYAITDGVFTGSTYIPNTSFPYPSTPAVDLSPILFQLSGMAQQLAFLQTEMAELKKDLAAVHEWAEDLPARLASWTEEIGRQLDARFDDVDRALRLVLDE